MSRAPGHNDREWLWATRACDDHDRLRSGRRRLPCGTSRVGDGDRRGPDRGLAIEVLDLPGSSTDPPSWCCCIEGLGSVGLWREFPAQLQAATGRRLDAFSRYGHGRSAPPAAPNAGFLPRGGARGPAGTVVRTGRREPGARRQRRRLHRLIHAAHHPVTALVALRPMVRGGDRAWRSAGRDTFVGGERERMARHHDNPDAAFWGGADVWLDPTFGAWSLEEEASLLTVPTLLVQGAEDPYGTLAQIDRIEACARGPVQRLVLLAGTARTWSTGLGWPRLSRRFWRRLAPRCPVREIR